MKKKNNASQSERGRREFIKLTTAGIAGSLAACAGSGVRVEGEAPLPAGAPAAAAAPVSGREGVPEVGELIDPEYLRAESWQEPWVWRPELWPRDSLELNVVQNQNPGDSPSPGNRTPSIFNYNGNSPAPTVRVRAGGELKLRVRNMLGLNAGLIPAGPGSGLAAIDMPPTLRAAICEEVGLKGGTVDPDNPLLCRVNLHPEAMQKVTGQTFYRSCRLPGHINGIHQAHTTNIHTHGLHVWPQTNPDGSHSDNVMLRIIPQADWDARMEAKGEAPLPLRENEHLGQLDYSIRLSFDRDGRAMNHPPGTHWYHPHSHGSTHDQVTSGMAGFLIVEGDVDEAINRAMTDQPWPDPTTKTGAFDYRERLMLMQRVVVQSLDLDAGHGRDSLRDPPFLAVNGTMKPGVIRMRPGAVERWRVLNGSVDGAGTKRFMVLEGQFVQREEKLWRVRRGEANGGQAPARWLEPVSEQDIEDAKVDLHQLSMDGITLVREDNGKTRHWIKDLSKQNAGTRNPLADGPRPGENAQRARLRAYESVFQNGETLHRSFVRPNEIYMTNANRADVLFKAPRDAAGKVYTVFAKEAHIHSDNFQQRLQGTIDDPNFVVFRDNFDFVVAYVHVYGEAVEGGDFDIQDLNGVLPPVPPLLMPVGEDELRVPPQEARASGVPAGSLRTRTISYSGIGATSFPHVEVPRDFYARHPELENLVWHWYEDVPILLQPWTGTMGINTEFDLSANPELMPPRKFAHGDPHRSRTLVNTAEEWVLYNSSMMLWGHTDRERFPQPGSYDFRYVSYPISRAEGQRRFAEDPEFRITAKGADHPFHIHVNPMWVLRIDVPDENGELHNVLPEPTWMDTVAIPRNGGRVVFRTRFDDFVGRWVNHCHILLHEDNGMMQIVECTDDSSKTNYRPRRRSASFSMSGAEVDALYPKPSLEIMYRQNMAFIDPSEVGGQVYPGFEFPVPSLKGES